MVRRSAVMVLLFQGKQGELRVVLTKRSRSLKHFSGHISLPGGKAEGGLESEFQCARRETEEEVGIERNNNILDEQHGCRIQELKVFPTYLARTLLGVAPCVGYLHWDKNVDPDTQTLGNLGLNPGESSSVFSVPLRDFLQPRPGDSEMIECLKQSHIKTKWGGVPWNLRSFIFPQHSVNEAHWLSCVDDLSGSEDETHDDHEFDVRTRNCWGLTANILHDVAQVVYDAKQAAVIGEEDLIYSLIEHGQMKKKERSPFETKMAANKHGCSFKEAVGDEDFAKLKTIYRQS